MSIEKIKEDFKSEIIKNVDRKYLESIDIDKFVEEHYIFISKLWNDNIKDKSAWLYHGTSILLLPFIKKYGLDTSRLPKGMKRAIENISKILAKGGSSTEGWHQDITADMSSKPLYFATTENVKKVGSAVDLPSFIYELLDEEYMQATWDIEHLREKENFLTEEEKDFLKVAFRFGKILRKKNRAILLQVKLDSSFLEYLDLPDYINSFENFYYNYLKQFLNRVYLKLGSSYGGVDNFKQDIENFCRNVYVPITFILQSHVEQPAEIMIKKPIIPNFIYIDVKHFISYKLVPLLEWNENMTPKLI
ncbi:hypothetical protein CL617_03820 [archaeon]|nr:hypothetical protein [archaeon]|tara:strand:+ start:30243 stop:31157 length:915 start_codon:yes stop_codon:yes gene_type:complete